jgi:hypothetical protein
MKTLKSLQISVFVLAILFFCGFGNANIARAQDGSGKVSTTTTTTTTTKTKPKTAKIVDKAAKTTTVKCKKKPDPPIADWEINNMPGRWTGRYSDVACTLVVERVEGDTFYGKMYWGEGFEIAMTGTIDRNTRKVTLTETEVLRVNPNGVWRLRVSSGTLPYGQG